MFIKPCRGNFKVVASFLCISRDTAGQERFHTITTSYYRGAMGILLVYDITNEKSFENIVKWLRNIDEVRTQLIGENFLNVLVSLFPVYLQHANEDVEKMILGNKCDMESKRAVSKEKGEAVSFLFIYYFPLFWRVSLRTKLDVEILSQSAFFVF